VIDDAASRLADLTNDLLDVSRIRMGQLALRLTTLDLAALAEGVIARYAERPEGRRAEIDWRLVGGLVRGDRDRLEQVLVNVIDNAIKYSPGGGTVRVRLRPDGGGLLLSVQDEGIGLPSGAAEAIFQPFGRAPNAARHQLPGMGLGLFICRSIVERHGGRIWAESEGEGRGTRLVIWLPAAEVAAAPTHSEVTDDAPASPGRR
jgi:signal transduction histidine kinase